MARRDKLSTDLLYLQIRRLLAERGAGGIWRPSAVLVARRGGPGTGVADRACKERAVRLGSSPLVARRGGPGTGVADRACKERAVRLGSSRPTVAELELLSQTQGTATPTEQRRLQLKAGEIVLRTTRLRRHEARTLMHEADFLAMARFPGLDGADIGNYAIVALARRCGIRLAHARERLSVARASKEAARHFDIAPRSPLLKLDRVIFAAGGEPVEWRVALCRPRAGGTHLGE